MIRNIIYLDEQKLISFLSQILEGFTEDFIRTTSKINEEDTSQKGPVASGRVVAEAIKSGQSTVEHRVLHDYAFSIFEKYLQDNDLLTVVNENSEPEKIFSHEVERPFVKVLANAKIIDAEEIMHLLRNFNKVGVAIAQATKYAERSQLIEHLETLKSTSKNSSEKQKISAQLKEVGSFDGLAKGMGLWQDPDLISGLITVMDYGFNKQLEVHQKIKTTLFSSVLKNSALRESKELIVRKHSRVTERKMVIIGTVTQTNLPKGEGEKIGNITHLKEAFINMIDHMADMEKAFSGKLANEVVIDPIAVYVEL